jgi:hypothetical protein
LQLKKDIEYRVLAVYLRFVDNIRFPIPKILRDEVFVDEFNVFFVNLRRPSGRDVVSYKIKEISFVVQYAPVSFVVFVFIFVFRHFRHLVAPPDHYYTQYPGQLQEAGKRHRNHQHANQAIGLIDKAITRVSGERSKLGAIQNRLEHSVSNLSVMTENLTAAESRIRDVDMAQAGVSMLAQAQQLPQGVLNLLR